MWASVGLNRNSSVALHVGPLNRNEAGVAIVERWANEELGIVAALFHTGL